MFKVEFERGQVVEFAEGEFAFEADSTHPYCLSASVEEVLKYLPATWDLALMGDILYIECPVERVTNPEAWGRWRVTGEVTDLNSLKNAYK